jgi:hypothetical protein
MHLPKLQHVELPTAHADTPAAIEGGAGAVQEDRQSEHEDERRKENEQGRRHETVAELCRRVPPASAAEACDLPRAPDLGLPHSPQSPLVRSSAHPRRNDPFTIYIRVC